MSDHSENKQDQRPPVWVGHVAIYSPKVSETSDFMQVIGMRLIASGDEFAVLEMRGGTHLVVTGDATSSLIKGDFDLMVDDLDYTHARYTEMGLSPGPIERGQIHDAFELQEPGGQTIVFNSTHVGDLPV
ncbi:MAG: hypothetical protein AAF353_02465 [Pseudomonadota bacterium]